MARNYKRDYEEIPKFSKKFAGEKAIDCIVAYAKKRGIVEYRAAKAFWYCVDSGEIKTEMHEDGYEYIAKEQE